MGDAIHNALISERAEISPSSTVIQFFFVLKGLTVGRIQAGRSALALRNVGEVL
jgi:hypothetical protein